MKHARTLIAAAAALLLFTALAARAEESAQKKSMEIVREALRADKKALVGSNLQLTDAEAKAFWPLYDKYQKELNDVGDRVIAIVADYSKSYADLPDDKATKLMQDYLTAEADRLKVRSSYLPEFTKILPGRTVARFYQIENKMDAVLRYELASAIPVVDEKPAPAPAK